MNGKSFIYEFTLKELAYFLFKKKSCPRCGGTMKKEKCCEIVDGSIFNTNSVPLYIQGRSQVKHYFYCFVCPECGSKFTLSELVQKGEKDLGKYN